MVESRVVFKGECGEYERLDLLGSGGQAAVYKVKRRSDGKLLAAKVYRDLRYFKDAVIEASRL